MVSTSQTLVCAAPLSCLTYWHFWLHHKQLGTCFAVTPEHHCMFTFCLSFIVNAETQRIVCWFISSYAVCFHDSHNYIHMFDVNWMWILFQRVHVSILMCLDQSSALGYTLAFQTDWWASNLIFFGTDICINPLQDTFSTDSDSLSSFPPKKCRLGSEFIKAILPTTSRNSTGGYENPKCFQVGLSVLRIWQKVDLSYWSPREFLKKSNAKTSPHDPLHSGEQCSTPEFWFWIEMLENWHIDPWGFAFTCKSTAGRQQK